MSPSAPRARAALLLLLASGCRSADPSPDPERTIPVSVLIRAAPERDGQDGPLDASLLAGELAEAFRTGLIFSEVRGEDGPQAGFSPVPADYVCEVEVRGGTFRADRSEATDRAILSTIVWFFTVFPSWWIADRLYPASDVEVRASFFPAAGHPGRPAAVIIESLPLNNLELDLRQRGNLWQHLLSLLLPPFWMEDKTVVENGLREEAVRWARMSLAEGVRRDWPAALLGSEPGSILILDPPRPAIGPRGARADLSAWLASRAPLLELRVFGEDGSVLTRLDRKALQALLVRPGRGEEERRGFEAVKDRLGGAPLRPQALYRLELKGLAVGRSGSIRIEAWIDEKTPGRFTVGVREVDFRLTMQSPR
jgi:hypothetical protein